ncbi:hypothetical protein [Rhodovulum sp. MB263]|uniref:hypothetical protein n=1 Tax=Rhodovulum sp. (strain MB263) TaxID=308754 RepID=UPI0012DB131D|nr:hypothetical protein [Rhodovulum sp. MB263]
MKYFDLSAFAAARYGGSAGFAENMGQCLSVLLTARAPLTGLAAVVRTDGVPIVWSVRPVLAQYGASRRDFGAIARWMSFRPSGDA